MDVFVLCLVAPATACSSSSSSSSSSNDVRAPLGLLAELSAFIEEAESEMWGLEQLTPLCLDSAEMPYDGTKP